MQITNIYISNVRRGKNKNWLIFDASITYLNPMNTYVLYYCGTELIDKYHSVPPDILEKLRIEIQKEFMPCQGLKFAKKAVENKFCYTIEI